MENDNRDKILDNRDFVANLYHNHKWKLIAVLFTTIGFFAVFYWIYEYPLRITEDQKIVKNETKSKPTLKSSLEDFISKGDSENLKDIFDDINNVSVWVFPPDEEYEWKIKLKELPREVKKYRSLGELWHIQRIISVDTLDNENIHVKIKFAN